MRKFESGATRNSSDHKIAYTGFFDPAVLHAFGEYMHKHRKLADGTLRSPSNWKSGIPQDVLMESLVRHVMDLWRLHDGGKPVDPDSKVSCDAKDLCCAIMFNVMAYSRGVIQNELQTVSENQGHEQKAAKGGEEQGLLGKLHS